MAKILILDIETAPTLAFVWQAWKQNIGLNQIKENGYLLSFAAKWLGDKKVMYDENRTGDDKDIIKKLLTLLDMADMVVCHNAKKFDIPTILGRAVIHGYAPPSPFKIIDTLITAKKEFKLFSNKLEYLAQVLGCAPKLKHGKFPGFELWLNCMKNNAEAWKEMREYNMQDVLTLEEVYLRLRPWIRNHPNVGIVMEEVVPVCPKCGSKHIHFRGYYTTNVSKFRKFQCQDCLGWGRARFNELEKEVKGALVVNAM